MAVRFRKRVLTPALLTRAELNKHNSGTGDCVVLVLVLARGKSVHLFLGGGPLRESSSGSRHPAVVSGDPPPWFQRCSWLSKYPGRESTSSSGLQRSPRSGMKWVQGKWIYLRKELCKQLKKKSEELGNVGAG